MNWDAIGANEQMFGSPAVFITQAYLAVQTHWSGTQMARTVSQARREGRET